MADPGWKQILDEVINVGESNYNTEWFLGYGKPVLFIADYVKGGEADITIGKLQHTPDGSVVAVHVKHDGTDCAVGIVKDASDAFAFAANDIFDTNIPLYLPFVGKSRLTVAVGGTPDGAGTLRIWVNTGGP